MSESKKEAVRVILPPRRQAPSAGTPSGESEMSFQPVSTADFPTVSASSAQPYKPPSISPPPGISPIADILPVPPARLRSEVEIPEASATLGGEKPLVPETTVRIKYSEPKSVAASSFKMATPAQTESITAGEMALNSTAIYLVLGASLVALGVQIWMLLAASVVG